MSTHTPETHWPDMIPKSPMDASTRFEDKRLAYIVRVNLERVEGSAHFHQRFQLEDVSERRNYRFSELDGVCEQLNQLIRRAFESDPRDLPGGCP